ncbi:MAG: SIR2 family protein [Prosthecobacter sp.]|jgi:hypothetical protein|uniref:SIR2 family NAD-dependent protein deacylase n=1 Tax=Prosthecobacter sp. TaxID=1965333 RepID=UPI001A0B1AA0|nr:SIR2 family protein [Prosthecobacter sp.]MBE2284433.1 SIR2 family protein [Prosthecobacter sp.]
MPDFENSADFKNIVEAVRKREVVLFLGAGIHYHGERGKLSYRKEERPLLAGELAARLSWSSHWYDRFNTYDHPAKMNFTRVAMDYELFSEEDSDAAKKQQVNSAPPRLEPPDAARYRSNGRHNLGNEVHSAVQLGRQPSPLLRLLADLGFPIVVTTNYDTHYEDAVKLNNPTAKSEVRWYHAKKELQPDTTYPIGKQPSETAPYIYKIHGHIGTPDSIVATDEDYIDFVMRMTAERPDSPFSPLPLKILSRMAEVPTLFIGYSLMDYNMRLLLKTLNYGREIFSNRGGIKSYAVSKNPDPLIRRVWQDEKCAIGFLAEDIWDFIPCLHAAVKGANP